MTSLYNLKWKFQSLLRPISNVCARAGVTANQVTVFAVVLSFIMGAILVWNPNDKWPLLLLPCFLFIRMALDAIDGLLAREHDMESNLGVVLNELGDVVSDSVLYLPLAVLTGTNLWLVIIFVLLALISEMTSVVGTLIGASRRNDGPLGKSDRAFWVSLMALLLGSGVAMGPWVNYYIATLNGLLVVTIFNRAYKALKESAHRIEKRN